MNVVIAEFRISCQELLDTDLITVTDPLVTAYAVNKTTKKREVTLGQTETLHNTLSPVFRETISITGQHKDDLLEFEVKDADHIGYDFIGSIFTTVDEILSSGAYGLYKDLEKERLKLDSASASSNTNSNNSDTHGSSNQLGKITIIGMDSRKPKLALKMAGKNIKKMDFWSESDPLIIIQQSGKNLYQSERIKDCKNPEWNDFEILLENFNLDEDCLVSCYDSDGPNAKAEFIGECRVNFREILGCIQEKEYKFRDIKSGAESGVLIVRKCLEKSGV